MDSLLLGAIIGGIVAAILVIILIGGLAACFYRSYRNSKDAKAKEKRRQMKNPHKRPTQGMPRPYPNGVGPYFLPRGMPSPVRKAHWNQRMLQYYYPPGSPYIVPMPYPMPRQFPQLTESKYKDATRDDESVSEQGTVEEEEVRQPPQQRPFVFAVPPMYYNFPMRERPMRPRSSVVIRELDNDIPHQRERREPEVIETREEEFQQHVTNITTIEDDTPVVSSIPGDVIFGNSTVETPITQAEDAHGQYSIIDSGLRKSTKVQSETIFNDPPQLSSSTVIREVETFPAQNESTDDVEYTVFVRRKNRESYTDDVPLTDVQIVNTAVDTSLSQTLPRRPPTPPFDALIQDSDTSLHTTGVSQKQDVEYFVTSTRKKNEESPFSLLYMDSIKEAVKSRRVDDTPSRPLELNESSHFSYRPPTPPPLTKQVSYEYYDNRGRDSEIIIGENNLSKTVQFNSVSPEIIPDIRNDSFDVETPIAEVVRVVPASGNIPPAPPLPPSLFKS